MAISLYDATVRSWLQGLSAAHAFLEKGAAHCREHGLSPGDMLAARLWPDMLPLSFQIHSIVHHSTDALDGVKNGVFRVTTSLNELDYPGMQALVAQTIATLRGLDAQAVDALQGADMVFEFRGRQLPFRGEDFLLSFSLPNFWFHATTAYDILRHKGVPLGKRDFLGALRLKQ
ncbi:MAG TPA: DUF1993 domain-containing protein [Burkholderiaceae bacterium]|nr:DUF1993 domain-containing protein [Burkholderiaceae bacterium]